MTKLDAHSAAIVAAYAAEARGEAEAQMRSRIRSVALMAFEMGRKTDLDFATALEASGENAVIDAIVAMSRDMENGAW